ncbi:Uncharacterised protein [Mycobacteroides abscessus subsp. abscessus]|nr:Uncharacterised protein [Mycobacteroides abscessus subsp. abscessus]
MVFGDAPQPGVEIRAGCHGAHIAGGGLGDDGGDVIALFGEDLRYRTDIVVRQHDGVGRRGAGDTGRGGQAEGGQAGPGIGQQRVGVPVVTACELDNLGASGESARQAHRAHGGFGAGVDQTHLFHGLDAIDDLAGELDLALNGRAVGKPVLGGPLHGLHHRGVRVAQDQRTPGADQVHIPVVVDIGEPASGAGSDEPRNPTDRRERAHRRVHSTWDDGRGVGEQTCGVGSLIRHGIQCLS